VAATLHHPARSVWSHTPVESVQLSVVHARPSLHVVAVAQTAPALQTPQPAGVPSLQRVPVFGVHDVVLFDGSQTWHTLDGFVAPVA
jgi:hypothetical protein